jgi:hypothetical protein
MFQKVLECPMCRLPLTLDLGELLSEEVKPEEPFSFVPSPEIRQKQKEMKTLFQQQKAKGGIIDLEEEKKKYFVDEVGNGEEGERGGRKREKKRFNV